MLLLVLYWPFLFVLTHIPLPQAVIEAHVSDKTLHFVTYFVLVFLLWGSLRPYEKVCWHKATVWCILGVMVWYGAMDEWLQGFVQGRSVDVWDFFADLAATLSCLFFLTVTSFWPAFLLLTGGAIFLLSACAQRDLSRLMPLAMFLFQGLSYAFFTGLWIAFRAQLRWKRQGDKTQTPLAFIGPRPQGGPAWLAVSLSAPLALMGVTKAAAVLMDKPLAWSALAWGLGGIALSLGGVVLISGGQRADTGDHQSAPVARN